jgi:NADPH:quinone reductase-like Zn-dependent oxidoreductase
MLAGRRSTATSRTAEKLEQVRALGLDEAICVDNSPSQFVERVRDLTGGAGVDVILDLVGGDYFPANLQALATGGRIICVGTTAVAESEIDLGLVLRKRATIIGTVLRARTIEEKAEATHRFAVRVLPLVSRGLIRPIVDRVYPAEEVRAAHEYLASNRTIGKVVLDFSM